MQSLRNHRTRLMLRRLSLASVALLLATLLATGAHAAASLKKGVGLANRHAPERIHELNLAWYYTWSPNPIPGVEGVEFVPMITGRAKLEDSMRLVARGPKPKYLLLINEPDHRDQANLSVDEVARLWPSLAELGQQVSSPAAAAARGPWQQRFHAIARARALKVDFMAVHLYNPPDAEQFLRKIDAIHAEYGLPIWITEFAVWDKSARDKSPGSVTPADTLAFMKAVLPELERRPYVQRYAWFGAGKGGKAPVRNSRLFNNDGSLTELGRFYADFGSADR